MFGDGYVFARDEVMPVKLEAGLVILAALRVIVESPAAAAAMDQMTDIVFLSRLKPHHAAFFPCGAPLIGYKPSFVIQWCREFIAVLTASFREVMIAG